jgi:hypothetical protein
MGVWLISLTPPPPNPATSTSLLHACLLDDDAKRVFRVSTRIRQKEFRGEGTLATNRRG